MQLNIFENIMKKNPSSIKNCSTQQVLQKALHFGYFINFFILCGFYEILHFQISYKCIKMRGPITRNEQFHLFNYLLKS